MASSSNRVMVIGLGSIARRHIRNLKAVDPACRIAVVRHRDRVIEDETIRDKVDSLFNDLREAIAWNPTHALITGPSTCHLEVARMIVRPGLRLLIEKPISNSTEGVLAFLDHCNKMETNVAVAYNFRFCSSLIAMRNAIHRDVIGKPLHVRAEVGQYLPDWRPGADYRKGVSGRRDLGGGVLLELSHEIDYVRWVMGEIIAVSCRASTLSELDIDVEDNADLIVEFESGAAGLIHMDMIQRVPSRSCRVTGSRGSLVWNGLTHEVRCFTAGQEDWSVMLPSRTDAGNEMYREEMKQFLFPSPGIGSSFADGYQGLRVVEVVEAAKRSSAQGARQCL